MSVTDLYAAGVVEKGLEEVDAIVREERAITERNMIQRIISGREKGSKSALGLMQKRMVAPALSSDPYAVTSEGVCAFSHSSAEPGSTFARRR